MVARAVEQSSTSNFYHDGDPDKTFWVMGVGYDPVQCFQAVEFAGNLRRSTFDEQQDLPCFSTPAHVVWVTDTRVKGVAVALCINPRIAPSTARPPLATQRVIVIFKPRMTQTTGVWCRSDPCLHQEGLF